MNPGEDDIKCYTDGSRGKETTGSGYVIFLKDHSRASFTPLGSYATVFQAEVNAIHLAASELTTLNSSAVRLDIFSDSQAALRALKNPWTRDQDVLQCQKDINNLAASVDVTLRWVPGHTAVAGDEAADTLAKRGASRKPVAPEPILALSRRTVKRAVETWKMERAAQNWADTPGCIHPKAALPHYSALFTRSFLRLNREKARKITNVISSQNCFNKHLHRIRKAESPLCPRCEEEETATHVVVSCPAYTALRLRHFHSLTVSLTDIITRGKLESLLSFLSGTGRLVPATMRPGA